MPSGSGGVHTPYGPLGFTGLFQSHYVLVSSVYHDCFDEVCRIREHFDVPLGYIPLFANIDRGYLDEILSVGQEADQRTVFSITFGHKRIGEQIERDGL